MTQSVMITLNDIRPMPAPIVVIKGIISNLPALPETSMITFKPIALLSIRESVAPCLNLFENLKRASNINKGYLKV